MSVGQKRGRGSLALGCISCFMLSCVLVLLLVKICCLAFGPLSPHLSVPNFRFWGNHLWYHVEEDRLSGDVCILLLSMQPCLHVAKRAFSK